MTLYLRNKNNRSIVDIDLYIKEKDGNKFIELNSSVIIDAYSQFLLENLSKKDAIIEKFTEIDELRGWLWESYFMGGKNDVTKYDDVLFIIEALLRNTAKEYNLNFIID